MNSCSFDYKNIENGNFRRIDASHILDLYIGKCNTGEITLLLIADKEPSYAQPSRILQVTRGLREDGRWALSFILQDTNYEEIFRCFCADIIESSRSLKNKDDGLDFITARYLKWQEMLKKASNGILTPIEIKGLIGELYFLKNTLINKLGETKAIMSWIGPEKGDQDFICDDIWYEIKAVSSGAEHLTISSIEQLDTEKNGELIVVYLDKTTKTDLSKITLNSIVNEIENLINSDVTKLMFKKVLFNYGYIRNDEYENYPFKFMKISRYCVNKKFPVIRRQNIPNAIINAQYLISIPEIINNIITED